MMKKKAVISLSGGLDSTCLLLHLLEQDYEVRAYSFAYGQKHSIELEKLARNIEFLQSKGLPLTHQVINLEDCFSDSASSLHKSGGEIPTGDYGKENMKSTVIENRNVIFSSIIYGKALGWANKTGDDVIITLGIHAGDHSLYPDTTPESQEMARELFRISNWGSERVDYVAPFVKLHKDEVLRIGLGSMELLDFSKDEINQVLANTHSCYSPDSEGRSCGKCGTCRERIECFEKNNMTDPIEYV